MWESNVRGTERVLAAAVAAGAQRIVHVSSVAVLGDTRGRVLDETAVGPRSDFLSLYDETKHAAHLAAAERAAAGAPVVLVLPAVVYGPRNRTQLGVLLEKAMRGRLPAISFAELGICAVHVDDVVGGLLLACGRGRTGEVYLLAGERTTLGGLFAAAATAVGRPRRGPCRPRSSGSRSPSGRCSLLSACRRTSGRRSAPPTVSRSGPRTRRRGPSSASPRAASRRAWPISPPGRPRRPASSWLGPSRRRADPDARRDPQVSVACSRFAP